MPISGGWQRTNVLTHCSNTVAQLASAGKSPQAPGGDVTGGNPPVAATPERPSRRDDNPMNQEGTIVRERGTKNGIEPALVFMLVRGVSRGHHATQLAKRSIVRNEDGSHRGGMSLPLWGRAEMNGHGSHLILG